MSEKVYVTTWGDGHHGNRVLAVHADYERAVADLPRSLEGVAASLWGSRQIEARRDEANDCWRCTAGTAFVEEYPVR